MNKVQILATGFEFMKEGVRGIEPVIEELINSAQEEIHIMAYIFTPSALHILHLLNDAAERGIKITMVVNRIEFQDEQIKAWLNSAGKKFPHVRVVNFCNPEGRQLHAKVIVSDRNRALVGSANFSWGGMVANYEIGILLEGDLAWKLAELIDMFISDVVKT